MSGAAVLLRTGSGGAIRAHPILVLVGGRTTASIGGGGGVTAEPGGGSRGSCWGST